MEQSERYIKTFCVNIIHFLFGLKLFLIIGNIDFLKTNKAERVETVMSSLICPSVI